MAEEIQGTAASGKVLVGLSGGVNSAVAAALLRNQGYDAQGVHFVFRRAKESRIADFQSRCCMTSSLAQAKAVAERLEMPFTAIDVEDLFEAEVVDRFVHDYLEAKKPNPCIPCNSRVKFRVLLDKADAMGIPLVATGHCAQVIRDIQGEGVRLARAVEAEYDQTYTLCDLTQHELRRVILPLGGITRTMVTKMAMSLDLDAPGKGASHEMCFVGHPGYWEFIERRTVDELRYKGVIRQREDGTFVGEHAGLYRFSLGQTRGFQTTLKDREGLYVVGFDPSARALLVGKQAELFQTEFTVARMNWIRAVDPIHQVRCLAKIGPAHVPAPCTVFAFENDFVRAKFDQAQWAITPGQAVVFYDGEEALGGGTIRSIGVDKAVE